MSMTTPCPRTVPQFKVGESAVYPAHGIATVKRIDEREINGKKRSFYVLQIIENQMTVMIPTDTAEMAGLRPIISDHETQKVFSILKRKDVRIDPTTWNRRYREFSDKIKTGSTFEIAEVLRDLYLLRHQKDLSFGERKMLDQAKAFLTKEISIAQQSQASQIEKQIQEIFQS